MLSIRCNLNQVIHGPQTELIANCRVQHKIAECMTQQATLWYTLPYHSSPYETILWHACRNEAANLCNKLVTVNWLRQRTLRPTKEPKQTPAHPESIQANRIKAHLLCQLHTHAHTHTPSMWQLKQDKRQKDKRKL